MKIFESNLQPMRYFAMQAEDKLNQWEQGIVEGYSTGFKTLDPYLRLEPSTYSIIAGRPSMGKTTLGMQMIRNVAQQLQAEGDDGVCTVFSAEMMGRSLTVRMAAEMRGINSHKLRMSKGTKEEYAAVRKAVKEIAAMPIYIDEGSAPSTKIMLARLEELNSVTPVRCMMFDFVELGGDEGDTEDLRVGSIHKSLKAIAKTLDIPVIGLSQVSRDVEKTSSKIPQMNHLRYSGQAEQVADKIATIMRPEYYLGRGMSCELDDPEPGDDEGMALVNVVKFRDGPTGMVRMDYEKEYGRFGDRQAKKVYL